MMRGGEKTIRAAVSTSCFLAASCLSLPASGQPEGPPHPPNAVRSDLAMSPGEEAPVAPRIVNGVPTSQFPAVVELVDALFHRELCSGTLIGCRTVLTAAHCVCKTNGSLCQGDSPDLERPSDLRVFAQHAGLFEVESIRVHPGYEFEVGGDLALLRLMEPVEGIPPAPLLDTAGPAEGTAATLVGFGVTDGRSFDSGVKRRGGVTVASCTAVPAGSHVCWDFQEPVGMPGDDSHACFGDSGAPLLVQVEDGLEVAAVASGVAGEACRPPDQGWAADVFGDLDWIRAVAGTDLASTACGDLPQVGRAGTQVLSAAGELSTSHPQGRHTFEVPVGTALMRVALNGERLGSFDLAVGAGEDPDATGYACRSATPGSPLEICEIAAPEPGTWQVLVDRVQGAGLYQVTTTLFLQGPTGACWPDATTLCLGQGRFRAQVDWETAGGRTGSGRVVPVGSEDSGLFYFFDADNWEMLLKIVRGCGLNGHYWVFFAATTDVGFTVTVTDTERGVTRRWANPPGHPADPVTDTSALPTCP